MDVEEKSKKVRCSTNPTESLLKRNRPQRRRTLAEPRSFSQDQEASRRTRELTLHYLEHGTLHTPVPHQRCLLPLWGAVSVAALSLPEGRKLPAISSLRLLPTPKGSPLSRPPKIQPLWQGSRCCHPVFLLKAKEYFSMSLIYLLFPQLNCCKRGVWVKAIWAIFIQLNYTGWLI